MYCCTLLYVHSSIAIILMGKRELIALLNLSSWCLVMVERLFLAVPRGCLQFVIVVFSDHTHLLFLGIGGPTVTTKMVARGFLMLKTTKKIWRIKKYLTYWRNETRASNYKTLQRANNIGDDLRLCCFWWLVCAISLFRCFVFSPGVMARQKDKKRHAKKQKNATRKIEKRPREKTK